VWKKNRKMESRQTTNMIPLLPERPDWFSAVGNFILNFGVLDWSISEFLEDALPQDHFLKIKFRHFKERGDLIRKIVSEGEYPGKTKDEFEKFFLRLKPVRELRNHIAHGLLRLGLDPNCKTWVLTLSIPRNLDGDSSSDTVHLKFEDLQKALCELTELIETFRHLTGLVEA
jgi:hypothetical protein